MKKILFPVLAVFVLFGALSIAVAAEEARLSADVYVTVSDKDGNLALTQEKITVTDVDSDNKLTVNDALYCAHEAKYEGGAAAGYASVESDYGLSLTKLWGTDNGGSYGYFINNVSAMGLTDEIKAGDYLNAFLYTDLVTWSDTYCFFDVNTKDVNVGDTVTLTLSAIEYDADYNPITVPVADADITINGKTTEYKTDAEGKATIQLDTEGNTIISASSTKMTLVPPVCNIVVSAVDTSGGSGITDENNENSSMLIWVFVAVVIVAAVGAIVWGAMKKKSDEK